MAEQLKVDIDQLERLHNRLDSALSIIDQEFEISYQVGSLVGDGGLAGAIANFSSDWNKHRFDIRDRLKWLKDSVGKIGESFDNIDTELAKALTAPPKPAAATAAPHSKGPTSV
jgi:hypothetical protein